MSSISILGDTSGSVLLQAPAVSGSTTITMAAQSGTLNVGGPTFSAVPNATQSISTTTWTKVLFQTETFDTNSNFASSTFTPTVAGYYQINAVVYCAGVTTNYARASIYKNGTGYRYTACSANSGSYALTIGDVVYFNGSTDYIEIYVYTGANETLNSPYLSSFSGCFLRAA